jgi:eukaryotic-like serine/threonine-protein kinase
VVAARTEWTTGTRYGISGNYTGKVRFGPEGEAQMLTALNHPNIAIVHGTEPGALVMELVEGSDLKGPLPGEEVMAIARQIVAGSRSGLGEGNIYRDLKPGNIKVAPAGVVKILGFGLAKSAAEVSASDRARPCRRLFRWK